MKIEHHFKDNACIHCGTTSANTPMCKLDGKPISVGEHNVARDPFRSIFDDFDAISERHRELFPTSSSGGSGSAPEIVARTCAMCGSTFADGQWQSCSGACCD